VRKLKKEIWPYQILVVEFTDKVDAWCTTNLGLRFRDWYSYDYEQGRLYGFKDSETLLLFKLRWKYKG
jgi:hypothetical protein